MTEVKLHYRILGEETSPWLVMLHGLFGSGDNLGGIARILAQNFRILLIDARNHGRSSHVLGMSYGVMADDVLGLMDELGIEQCILFGHSMGGKTAMQLALNAPERITKLIVGDIAPVAYERHHELILDGMQKVADAAPQSRKEAETILSAYESEPAVLSFLLTNWRKNREGTWSWRIGLAEIIEGYVDIMQAPKGKPFAGPTLFLRGDLSDYIQASHRDEILALYPNATVKSFAGCGHWLHAEKPDMVARAILRFIG